MASKSSSKNFLYLTVHEASGLTRDKEVLWEPSFTEGFVKVELRSAGDAKSVKVNTPNQTVDDYTITWDHDLRLEITEKSQELRIMLCKERPRTGSGKKVAVVEAACGIYVADILKAVPIDKYFELFKPSEMNSGLGGFVRIQMKSVTRKPLSETSNQEGSAIGGYAPNVAADVQERLSNYTREPQEDEPRSKRRHVIPLLLVGAAAAVVTSVKMMTKASK